MSDQDIIQKPSTMEALKNFKNAAVQVVAKCPLMLGIAVGIATHYGFETSNISEFISLPISFATGAAATLLPPLFIKSASFGGKQVAAGMIAMSMFFLSASAFPTADKVFSENKNTAQTLQIKGDKILFSNLSGAQMELTGFKTIQITNPNGTTSISHVPVVSVSREVFDLPYKKVKKIETIERTLPSRAGDVPKADRKPFTIEIK